MAELMKILKNALPALIAVAICGSAGMNAQTQGDLNDEACGKYKRTNAELNKVYGRILREYGQDQVFIQKLKVAQRAWIAFRDAHLESIYPNADPRWYGSVNPRCRCIILTELTAERTKVLQQWDEGREEGDVCLGSIKMKVRRR